MNTLSIRKKLHQYIETAQDKKVKAIYTMIENEIDESESQWPDELLEELNKRAEDFESDKVKGRTWEEVKKKARQTAKSKSI